jgi:hypothetical protein
MSEPRLLRLYVRGPAPLAPPSPADVLRAQRPALLRFYRRRGARATRRLIEHLHAGGDLSAKDFADMDGEDDADAADAPPRPEPAWVTDAAGADVVIGTSRRAHIRLKHYSRLRGRYRATLQWNRYYQLWRLVLDKRNERRTAIFLPTVGETLPVQRAAWLRDGARIIMGDVVVGVNTC